MLCPQENQLFTQSGIISEICHRIPDNNAGSISAADVRQPMQNLAFSVNKIVAEGDHNVSFPFIGSVKTMDDFIAEKGINFPNGGGRQTEPYPGASNINHNLLNNRNNNEAHPNYLTIDGTRPMQGSIQMNGYSIAASGNLFDDRGLKFEYTPTEDQIKVGSATSVVFSDGSKMKSGRGLAKAWINFDASESPLVVRSYHNVETIKRIDEGKFEITIPSGVLRDENCVVIGSSNSRSSASNNEDFDRNTVGVVNRDFISASGTVVLSFAVLNEQGEYINAELNDLVVFGHDVDEPINTGIDIIDE
jgi:hypothetical protein